MRALVRIVAVALAGAVLYYSGTVNAMVIEHPDALGAVLVVAGVGLSLAMTVVALVGDGQGDTRAASSAPRVRLHQLAWLVVCLMALVGASWLLAAPRQRSVDWTPYHNDAIALNECAARLLLVGRDPYTDLDVFACYRGLGIGPDRTTPLREGRFAAVPIYPSDDQLDAAWAARSAGPASVGTEFESKLSYPALSVLVIAPWVALGWDTNVLYELCLLAAMALVVAGTRMSLRPFVLTGLLGAACLSAFTVGGSADVLYALPLVAAWRWRERRWSGVLLGLAVATKQLAWFFAPFYLIAVAARLGRRAALGRALAAAAVLALTNGPFVLTDPGAWLAGVLAPIADPMFPRGAGLVFLATNQLLGLWPPLAYTALEALAGLACVIVAWRARRSSPELGVALAVLPLFFAYRSLFSYFFLLPLFAFAAIARLPRGELGVETARGAGGLTVLALPARIAQRSAAPVAAPLAAD